MMTENATSFDFPNTQNTDDSQTKDACYCMTVLNNPQTLHQCQLCKRNINVFNDLQQKVEIQAQEIVTLKKEIKSYKAQMNRQQLDYHVLHNKYVAGMEQVAHIQQQKNQADREIEELSTRLFEEANVMVANERKKSIQLEKILQRTEDQLQVEQGQLRELKNRIESIANAPQPHFPEIKDALTSQTNSAESNKDERCHRRSTSTTSLSTIKPIPSIAPSVEKMCSKKMNFDAGLSSVRDFQSYMDRFKSVKKTTHPKTPDNSNSPFLGITKDHEYIQLCEKEDVEPCLQFGISSSRMCTKTMMEYMMQKPCFIETVTMKEARRIPSAVHASAIYRPFWERLTTTTTPAEEMYIECAACKRRFHILQYLDQHFYRFRLDEQEDWLLIDKSCRNRLVAVCNFYSFLRNIQLGYYHGRSLKDLYAENVQLKMQIFYSR